MKRPVNIWLRYLNLVFSLLMVTAILFPQLAHGRSVWKSNLEQISSGFAQYMNDQDYPAFEVPKYRPRYKSPWFGDDFWYVQDIVALPWARPAKQKNSSVFESPARFSVLDQETYFTVGISAEDIKQIEAVVRPYWRYENWVDPRVHWMQATRTATIIEEKFTFGS